MTKIQPDISKHVHRLEATKDKGVDSQSKLAHLAFIVEQHDHQDGYWSMLQYLTGCSKLVCCTWALSTDIFFFPPCIRWRNHFDCLCWEFKMFIWIALIKNQCNDCQNQKSGSRSRTKPARRWFSDRDPLVVAESCPRGRDSVEFWNDDDDDDVVMVMIMMLTIMAMMMLRL